MCLYITGGSNSTSVKHLIHNYRGKGNINLQILSQVALLFLSFLCVCVLVAQLCPTLCDPMYCSPPGFSVCGIFQARILEWVAMPF